MLLLPGLSVLIAGGAVLIQMYARHRFPGFKGEAHNDVTRFAFTVIAFLYAFLSGFLINAMWGQVNSADGRAATEGSAGMQQAKSLTVFDKADSDRSGRACTPRHRHLRRVLARPSPRPIHPHVRDRGGTRRHGAGRTTRQRSQQ